LYINNKYTRINIQDNEIIKVEEVKVNKLQILEKVAKRNYLNAKNIDGIEERIM
jgi:hypothetical protein